VTHPPASVLPAAAQRLLACLVLLCTLLAGGAHDLLDAHDGQHDCVACSALDRLDSPLPVAAALAALPRAATEALPAAPASRLAARRRLRPATRAPPR
jgi:hypothetical protein